MSDPTDQVVSHQPFRQRRVIRWSDCDPAGVVYTGKFTDYLLGAVFGFLRGLGYAPGSAGAKALQIGLPCKHMSLTFHVSLYPDDIVDIEIFVAEIRNRSFDLAATGRLPDGRIAFEGVFSPICIIAGRRESCPIPDALRAALIPHLVPEESQS